MNRNRIAGLLFAFVLLAFGAVQVGAQGTLTLENLAERLNRTDTRVAALETVTAPTATKTRRPTATATKRKPAPTATVFRTPTPEPLLNLDVEDVFDDYLKYEGMALEVYGKVIRREDDSVELHVSGWFTYFVCWLSPDHENLPLVLDMRQEVVLRGENLGKENNTVFMTDCLFIWPSPSDLKRQYAARVASTATARSVEATQTVKAQKTRAARQATRRSATATAQARMTMTAQARPTATRRPDATPIPGNSNYRDKVELILVGDGKGYDVGTALSTLGDAFTRAGRDATLLLNDAWKIEVALAVAVLQVNYEDARKLNPPANLRKFHNLMVEGLSYCDLAGDQLLKGVDNVDADALEDGVGLIQLCTGMLERASTDPNW